MRVPSRYTILRVVGLPVRVFFRRLRVLFRDNENALFFTAVCLTGLLGGLAGAAFRWLLALTTGVFWGRPGPVVIAALAAPWYLRLLVPMVGGALAAALMVLFAVRRAREESGGFPEIM
ncbi:MAG: hypothetical protein ABR559_10230 [Gemmatimonadota bacterium]